MTSNLLDPLSKKQSEKIPEEFLDSGISLQANESVFRKILHSPMLLTGLILLSILILFSLFGPYFSSHSYFETCLDKKNFPPCKDFWFGTDELGRDIFTRVFWGARISLFVGISAAFVDLIVGVLWGTLAGFFGKALDEMLMRVCDILSTIPYLIRVILLTVIFGPGLFSIILTLTITGWIPMARIVRGQIIQLKQQDFFLAAKILGASSPRIIFRHLLPNSLGPILVTMTMTIPSAIFTEAALSFLGLGIQAPFASWGTMVNDGLSALRYYPWRLFFPSIAIYLTLFSFHLLGDGFRDLLDPRVKK
jgi:oligopeptide transport system permease protein